MELLWLPQVHLPMFAQNDEQMPVRHNFARAEAEMRWLWFAKLKGMFSWHLTRYVDPKNQKGHLIFIVKPTVVVAIMHVIYLYI